MVRLWLTGLLAGIAVISGCVSNENDLTTETVGPAPDQPRMLDTLNGTLVVYSAYKRNAYYNSADPNLPEHSDYKILATDGHLLCRVHNITKTGLQDAVTVGLTPGKYLVVARANAYGYVMIPVVVAAQKCTVLHLEGGGYWPNGTEFNETNSVSLPNGQIIGWKNGSSL